MRSTRWIPLALCIVSLGSAALLWSCSPAMKGGGAMSAEQKVARGRYLVTVLGCSDCHTPGYLYGSPDTTRLLSGSELGWRGPWGVSFAPNLTPDSTTGIGTWTEDQIVTAIRTGRRPDNTQLLPPMPWPDFAFLTDDDAHAVAAFVMSIPPIKHENVKQVPPGQPYAGAVLAFPPPPAWDAPKGPPPGGAPADTSGPQ